MSLVKDRCFRDVLVTLWEVGLRPQEFRALEARHYNKERGAWILDRVQSKGKKKQRVIYLTDNVKEIHERLAKRNPTGKLFRNCFGKAWTKNAVRLRFHRIAAKVDFPCFAYLFRHGFATHKLLSGADSMVVAKLMGHSSTAMLEKHYEHATKNDAFMQAGLSVGMIASPAPASVD